MIKRGEKKTLLVNNPRIKKKRKKKSYAPTRKTKGNEKMGIDIKRMAVEKSGEGKKTT